jgi:G3E family GTPase
VSSSSTRIPTILISGFLGSGKTTIISHLIDDLQAQGIQCAYIKNEVGDATIDSQMLASKHIQTRELLNGCICCTLVGDFHSALTEIAQTVKPDRIIVEGSGVSDPVALAVMLGSHPHVQREAVAVVIDTTNFTGISKQSKTARTEARVTDIIIFNKIELTSVEEKQRVVGYVRELNEYSPIVEAPKGRVNAGLLLNVQPHELDTLLASLPKTSADHSAPDHLHEDGIESFSVTTTDTYSVEKIKTQLMSHLPPSFFRLKGVILTDHGWQLLNAVKLRLELTPLASPPTPEETHLICIGFHIGTQESALHTALKSCIF